MLPTVIKMVFSVFSIHYAGDVNVVFPFLVFN